MSEFTTPVEREVSHYDQLYPGRFLKAGLFLGQKVTKTIDRAVVVELPNENNQIEQRAVIKFRDSKMDFVCNVTNGQCCRAMFGDSLENWKGKRLTLHPTTTKVGGKDTPCIRVWGSPDIAADFEVEVRLPRKKPFKMTMHKAVLGNNSPPATATDDKRGPGRPKGGPNKPKDAIPAPTANDLAQADATPQAPNMDALEGFPDVPEAEPYQEPAPPTIDEEPPPAPTKKVLTIEDMARDLGDFKKADPTSFQTKLVAAGKAGLRFTPIAEWADNDIAYVYRTFAESE